MSEYYVYTYIDPRNFEEFYYGKGKGSRKDAHLSDEKENSEKVKRIQAIRKAGLEPIIRVIATQLTQAEALLVEATLIWKLGRFTLNDVSGHFRDKFRPHNTYHLEVSRFDYRNSIYYYNVGEGPHRNWDDYLAQGFISAGQGPKWRDAICAFREGDVIAAYLKRHGYVGIGKILKQARKSGTFESPIAGYLIFRLGVRTWRKTRTTPGSPSTVALVEWQRTVSRSEAKWAPRARLFTTTHVRASLDNQPSTVDFLNKAFNVDIRALIV